MDSVSPPIAAPPDPADDTAFQTGRPADATSPICAAANDWASKARALFASRGDHAADAAVDACEAAARRVIATPARTASDLVVKLRVACCEFLGMEPPPADGWPEPRFGDGWSSIPDLVMAAVYADALELARRAPAGGDGAVQ